MPIELYKKYRPKGLHQVLGQGAAVQSLEKFLAKDNLPHSILLTGPSGVGKTTIARILQKHLDCSDRDFYEKNCADFKGIDDIRDIRRSCTLAPLAGRCRIWLIDECHKLTNDAQHAILKLLEDTPSHVYFMLATTDPQKLLRTIHTRYTQIKLGPMGEAALGKIVWDVIEREGLDVAEEVVEEIIEAAEGSARKALVILEQVGSLETKKEQLSAVAATSASKEEAIVLARLLLQPNSSWSEIAKVLKDIEGQESEGIRWMVLVYMRSVLLGGQKQLAPRAFTVIDVFSKNFWDSKHAGLAAACWEVTHQ